MIPPLNWISRQSHVTCTSRNLTKLAHLFLLAPYQWKSTIWRQLREFAPNTEAAEEAKIVVTPLHKKLNSTITLATGTLALAILLLLVTIKATNTRRILHLNHLLLPIASNVVSFLGLPDIDVLLLSQTVGGHNECPYFLSSSTC